MIVACCRWINLGWPMKYIALLFGSMLVLSSIGCCTPGGCGFGCRQIDGCYDCEGGFGQRTVPGGPIDALRQARKSLVCGGGCGEVYWGEWRSTPPDCQDPCCDDQFVGGATPCRPFCWQPGTLLRGLYGSRIACNQCGSFDECGCGGGVYEGAMIDGHQSSAPADCGCSGQADSGSIPRSTVVRQSHVTSQPAQTTSVTARPLPGSSIMTRSASTGPSRTVSTQPQRNR